MERVTLREVADRAGVSLATASKVMNGRGDVRETTRGTVQESARALGYSPRRRDGGARRSLVLVFDSLRSPYSLQILHGATLAARRAGVDLTVTTTEGADGGDAPILSRGWFREIADRGHAGVIAVTVPLAEKHVRWSRACSLPLLVIDPVTIDPEVSSLSGLVRISATNWAGGRAATQHLLDLGHRRIGLVTGEEQSVPVRERLDGYRSALEQAGIAFDPALISGADYSFEEGRAVGHELLEAARPPTAIFATADTIALGVLRAAREVGVAVPEDLSVIGFDDTLLAGWSNPQLTVIQQPLFSMGQISVERALALAADPGLFAHPFQLETRLIVRETTAPAPAGR